MMEGTIEDLIQQNELSIEDAKWKVKRWKAIERLKKNKDWQFLIEEELLKEDIVRLTLLLSSPQLKGGVPGGQQAEQLALVKDGIQSRLEMIGEFSHFLRLTENEGRGAHEALAEHERTREELLREQLEEDNV